MTPPIRNRSPSVRHRPDTFASSYWMEQQAWEQGLSMRNFRK